MRKEPPEVEDLNEHRVNIYTLPFFAQKIREVKEKLRASLRKQK